MAITLDQANIGTAASSAGGTTISFNTNQAVAAGARIVVSGGVWGPSDISVSSVAGGGLTWTIDKQGHAAAPANPNPYIASASAPSGLASGTTITVTFSASATVTGTVGGSSFLGIDTTTPVDTTSGPIGVDPAATAWASPSTAIAAGSLLIATCWNETNNSASTPDAGSTEALDFSHADGFGQTTAYRIEASAGSYTVSGAWGTAGKTTTVAVAFKATGGQSVALGQVTETDTAQALARSKAKTLGQIAETDTAQALARAKALTLGLVTEADTAQAIGTGAGVAIGQATEAGTAQALSRAKAAAIGQALEADTAQALSRAKTLAVGQVAETDIARALTAQRSRALGQVTETDTARTFGTAKATSLGRVTETDTAQTLTAEGGGVAGIIGRASGLPSPEGAIVNGVNRSLIGAVT